tara:strand:- start:44 stop:193 length:150 start_codon:yes stop_codon:yes gene_type:complete
MYKKYPKKPLFAPGPRPKPRATPTSKKNHHVKVKKAMLEEFRSILSSWN